jgi:hypothetical protein
MAKKKIQIIIGLLSLISLLSCEQEQFDNTFNSVKIQKWIMITDQYIDTMVFEYNNDDLLIKGSRFESFYFINEYDDLHRITKSSSFDSNRIDHCRTFQYDSNTITTIDYQRYPYHDTLGGGKTKHIYHYNSQNNCERIDSYSKNDIGDWIKSDYYQTCTWVNNNLTEFHAYNGNNLEYAETYQYDNKLNPKKMLDYIISPWTKSKNNMISCTVNYSDDSQATTTYEYSYNKYGYPTEQIRTDALGITIEKYEYKFE